MSAAQARIIPITARRRSGTEWTRPLLAYQPTAARSPSRSWESAARSAGSVWRRLSESAPELLRMAFGESGEGATGADGTELVIISDDDQLCSGSFDGG